MIIKFIKKASCNLLDDIQSKKSKFIKLKQLLFVFKHVYINFLELMFSIKNLNIKQLYIKKFKKIFIKKKF